MNVTITLIPVSHIIYQIRSNLITNSISLSTVYFSIGQNRKDKVCLSDRAEYVHHLHSSWEKSSTAAGISTAVYVTMYALGRML